LRFAGPNLQLVQLDNKLHMVFIYDVRKKDGTAKTRRTRRVFRGTAVPPI